MLDIQFVVGDGRFSKVQIWSLRSIHDIYIYIYIYELLTSQDIARAVHTAMCLILAIPNFQYKPHLGNLFMRGQCI